MRTFSITVRCGNTAEIWNERTMPRRATSAGRSAVMSRPSNTMRPRLGVKNLLKRLKQVVLPAPLGPIMAWILPRATRRLTPRTATKPAKSLARSSVSRTEPFATMFPHDGHFRRDQGGRKGDARAGFLRPFGRPAGIKLAGPRCKGEHDPPDS